MVNIIVKPEGVFKGAKYIEDVLCFATMVASEIIHQGSEFSDCERMYEKLGECEKCPAYNKCLAVRIND